MKVNCTGIHFSVYFDWFIRGWCTSMESKAFLICIVTFMLTEGHVFSTYYQQRPNNLTNNFCLVLHHILVATNVSVISLNWLVKLLIVVVSFPWNKYAHFAKHAVKISQRVQGYTWKMNHLGESDNATNSDFEKVLLVNWEELSHLSHFCHYLPKLHKYQFD